jgi:hypothetical protein
MQHDNQLSDQDLQKVFEYLTSADTLFIVKAAGRNPGEVHSRVKEILRGSLTVDTDKPYPIARLAASDTETLLFQSLYAKKFAKFIEKRIRMGNLALHEFGVTKADAATALDFYRHATFQARDFIYLTYLYLSEMGGSA